MYCQKCAAVNDEDASYCDNCGAMLKNPTQPSTAPSPSSTVSASPTTNVYLTAPAVTPASRTNGLAIAALVLGLIAIAFYWLIFIGLPLGLLAAIFGMVAQSQIRAGDGSQSGVGMAVAGIVLGAIAVLVPLLLLGACTACITSIPR